jgi:hypothetical protein
MQSVPITIDVVSSNLDQCISVYNDNSVLNATASTFVSHETRDKFITSTPMQTTNQSKDIHS